MTWMTPFSASTSAWITVASFDGHAAVDGDREQAALVRLRLAVARDLGRRDPARGECFVESGGIDGGEQSLERPCLRCGFHDVVRICLQSLLV